ncbi:hypothetical protein [Aurantimonas sp. Leaf443]|uniref:hypothetical protein n=1 Tax=Aurantimonas sp. Leaf443 TaxID=1736378 RepID=UPI0006F27119|nr:hypothetical protein [Aurantimonas sp. Leaf443]KQT83121.1 hypothetical protein ASG48_14205 [Aurantimonas sp. Leaf443]
MLLPTTITTALRRRPAVRLVVFAAGYLVAAVLGVGGLIAFSTTGEIDALMGRGAVMVAGIVLGFGTGELRRATRPQRKLDPSNPTTA